MLQLKVQSKACSTCIYRKDSALDIKVLEAAIKDKHMAGFFKGHRVCHHSKDAVCRGFWNRHKDKFTLGQIAQRLKAVIFVKEDTLFSPATKEALRKNKEASEALKVIGQKAEKMRNLKERATQVHTEILAHVSTLPPLEK